MVLAAFGLYHSQIETEEREDSLLTFHVAYLKNTINQRSYEKILLTRNKKTMSRLSRRICST